MQAAQRLVARELGPFVEVEIGGDVLAKTSSRPGSRVNPVWHEAFSIDVCHDVSNIKLRVRCLSRTAVAVPTEKCTSRPAGTGVQIAQQHAR